jgi:hypothetical protein
VSINDGVFLFRADDWDDAFQKALALGRREEREYVNGEGERVRWRFAEVLQMHGGIDSDRDLEGQEVMTEMLWDHIEVGYDDLFDGELHPEQSDPASS